MLVRRVVEARRQTAGDSSAQTIRTPALPPVNEKHASSSDPPSEKGGQDAKESFWKKLRCW